MSEGNSSRWRHALAGLGRRISGAPFNARRRSLTIQRHASSDRLLMAFIIASVPAALCIAWRTGIGMLNAVPAPADGDIDWPLRLLDSLGLSLGAQDHVTALLAGVVVLLPVFVVAAAVSAAWAVTFSALRDRITDPAWLMTAWLLALLVDPSTPLILVAVGASFAAVFGLHVFGGTGRYIASPAVIGALFVQVAYPVSGEPSSWQLAVDSGAGMTSAPFAWSLLLNAAACITGALWLLRAGAASWRSLAAALLGLLLASLVAGWVGETTPAHLHFLLGSFAFGWAFLLTDPTTLPLTRMGRWLHGGLFGALVVLMREADPTHPESTLFAILLAALAVPLIDFIVLRTRHGAGDGRLEIGS